MRIYSKYENPLEGKLRGEVPNPDTPCYVDPVGFISMEQQIKGLINAGVNLENYRRTQFDYQYGDEVDIDKAVVSVENDPDFMPSIDMPQIMEAMEKSNTAPAPSPGPTNAPEAPGGETIPPEQTDAS